MIDMLQQFVAEINSLPEYFGKGLVELTVLVVGGIIVAWITSTYFAQRAAESEVKGDIVKKKLDVYEALVVKLDGMQQQVVLPQKTIDLAIKNIHKHKIQLKFVPQYPVADMFQTGDRLTETVLDMDRFISSNRIYFEKGLYEKLQFFQNYIIIFNRLIVIYREHFVNAHIPLDNQQVKGLENLLSIELGLVFQDELSDEIDSVSDAIRDSVNNIKFNVQASPDHSSKRFGPDGVIVQELLKKKIMTEREHIKRLIEEHIVNAMFAAKHKS